MWRGRFRKSGGNFEVFVDTNICIAFLSKRDAVLARKMASFQPGDFVISSVGRGELLYGARKSARTTENLSSLGRFLCMFTSVPFDDTAAEHYGVIRSVLERSGTPIGANDLLIASTALAQDLTRRHPQPQGIREGSGAALGGVVTSLHLLAGTPVKPARCPAS